MIYSLSNFHIYSMVLTIVIRLYITTPNLIYLVTGSLWGFLFFLTLVEVNKQTSDSQSVVAGPSATASRGKCVRNANSQTPAQTN